MRDPPRPGLEPVSPALAGRLSTTAPPGKPCAKFYIYFCVRVCVCVCVCVIYLIVGVLARGFYEASKVMQILSHDQSLSLSDSEACTLNYYANWPLRQLGTL